MVEKKYIFLSTSKPVSSRAIYNHKLAESITMQSNNIKVILIYDKLFKPKKHVNENIISFTWPSKRPNGFMDFVFFYRLVKKYKPIAVFSSFGSVNIFTLIGYFMKVPCRSIFILSTPKIFTGEKYIQNFKDFRKKIIYRLLNLFIGNTEGVIVEYQKYFHYHFKPNLVLHNLIEDKYSNTSLRKNQVVIVGGLTKLKGHDYLLAQYEEMITTKDLPLDLIIVGDGKERKYLENKYKHLIQKGFIKFTGKVSKAEVYKIMANSLVHISSSTEEAFGFVNIESLMQATPILYTETSGSKFIIQENVNGRFF